MEDKKIPILDGEVTMTIDEMVASWFDDDNLLESDVDRK